MVLEIVLLENRGASKLARSTSTGRASVRGPGIRIRVLDLGTPVSGLNCRGAPAHLDRS